MFIKANGNLINADHVARVVIDWDGEFNEGEVVFVSKDPKIDIDKVTFKDKEEFDKYVKYLKDRLSYELDIISELQDINTNLDGIGHSL